jgi:hypothetical protein
VITACALVFSVAIRFEFFIDPKIAPTDYQIAQTGNQTINYTYYYYANNDFLNTEAFKITVMTNYIFRDLVLPIALVVLNVLILIEIKRVTRRRIFLVSDGLSTSLPTTSHSVMLSLTAERRKLMMMIATGINFFLGRLLGLLNAIGYVFNLKLYYFFEFYCILFFFYILYHLSYATPFFLYYFFNIHFRTFANDTLKLVLSPFFFLSRKVNVYRDNQQRRTTTQHELRIRLN